MGELAPQEGLIERIYWLIRLRWIAVIGVSLTIFAASKIFKLSLPVSPLYTIASLLCIYNLVFFSLLHYFKKRGHAGLFSIANRIANLQIALDLIALAVLVHFSGGIENPFIFYFIFHMIIASILLSRRASFLQATFSVSLFILTVSLEYLRILPHYCLKGFLPYTLHNNLLYILGVLFVFMTTLYIAVYMATSISGRLRAREESLKEANLLLEEKDRIKSEYVLRVSHDIKEHLSAIQGCLEPVSEGITGQMNQRQKDLIQRAVERTGKLMFFVKALLEVTRIKLSRQIEMDFFSLKKTVDNAVSFIEAKAKAKDISLICEVEPAVDKIRGAQIYIEETIANLLANAVKYTPRGGRINMAIQDRGNTVLIQITDTGIGIPEDELPHVFDEFYRARNARETERDGTGLGLSIAKQVIERHKGRIWVESVENQGSTFSVLLPK